MARTTKREVESAFERLCAAVGVAVERHETRDADGKYVPTPNAWALKDQGITGHLWTIDANKTYGHGTVTTSGWDLFGISTPFMSSAEFVRCARFAIGCLEAMDPAGVQQRIAAFYREQNTGAA